MDRGKCYIGTSGWSYAHWAKGRFYPQGLKPGEWLRFLAQHFNSVEVNSSFYRLPKRELLARWRAATGARFRFAVKLWRRITHDKRLSDCALELSSFFAVVNELGPKRGPLLVQLPPSLRKDVQGLDEFLALLKETAGRAGAGTPSRAPRWKVAVEFRNPDWLCAEVYELLNRCQAALCLADLPRCPIPEPNDVPFVYIRRHGPAGGYRGCYTTAQIAADAARIRHWLDGGKDVFVYYNNDIDGHAVDNARSLLDAIQI